MTAPPHRIRRLVLEVTLADEDAAWSVQSELARLHGPGLEAIIDRCCAEASDPDRIQRIESLELDLGTLSQDNLEPELLARIGPLLGEALAVRLAEPADTASGAGEPAETTARLELVAYFAQTGNLPWWAETNSPQLIDKTLGQLLQDGAASVVSLMGELLREPAALQRLVRHCGDERLTQLLAVLTAACAPQSIGRAGEVETILRAGQALPGATADSYRGAFWSAVFGALSSAGTNRAGPMDFWGPVLAQTAAEMSMTYRELLTALEPKLLQATEQGGALGAQQEPEAVAQQLSGLINEMRGNGGRKAEVASAPGNAPPRPESGSPARRGRVAERPGSIGATGAAAEPEPRWPQGVEAELGVQAELSSGGDPDSDPAAQLELVAYFAQTGNLPRWAEASRPQLIDKTLGQLLQDGAASMVSLMGELLREPAALQRLVRHCGDGRLAQLWAVLTAAWAPQSIGRAEEMETILRAGQALPGATADSYRVAFWSAVFGTLSSAGTNRAEPRDFWGAVLEQTAAEMSMAYRDLLTALETKLPQATEQAGDLGAQQEPEAVARQLGGLLSGLIDEMRGKRGRRTEVASAPGNEPPRPEPGSPARRGRVAERPGSIATTGAAAEPEPRWPQRVEAELGVQAELSSGGDPDSDPAAQLELVAYFAQTGNLPRWAETSRPQLIDKTLGQLLQDGAASVVSLMGELLREPAALQRLVRHCGDDRLAQLLAVLTAAWAPQSIGRAEEVETILRAGKALPGATADSYRGAFWSAVFGALTRAGTDRAEPINFWGPVLEQTAAEMSMAYRELLTALDPKLLQATEQAGDLGAQQEPEAVAQQLGGLINETRVKRGRPAEVTSAAGNEPLPPAPGSPVGPGALLDPQGLAAPRVAELKDASVSGDPEGTQEALEVQTPRALRPNTRPLTAPDAGRKPPRPNLAYSDTDEVYVENAGVVILWPFLELFFTRLELMADKKFKDAAALHRAAGLVGYLVNGEPSPPEYQLALPKVLCGLETTEVFNFGPPVTEAEAEEGASLLAAVIANAPILKEMSVDGFRGTFLMRKGVLSAESGAWLLRVERVSYDVVLDRFPWGVSWVKLPWMEAPLSVEW